MAHQPRKSKTPAAKSNSGSGSVESAKAFEGTWRITSMELWAMPDVDMVGPGFFGFRADGFGNFRFICVEGDMDCRYGQEEGKPSVAFSWDGHDELDPVNGRGSAVIDGDTLSGQIVFHRGNESGFTARREQLESKRAARKAPRRRS